MLQPMTITKRNRFPKLSLNFTTMFKLEMGEFYLDAHEISNEELRVTCPAGDIPLLVPRTAHHRPDEKITHQAVLVLDEKFSVNAQVQVLSCRRYSQQGFNVTFRITELSDQQQQDLEAFLSRAIEKNIPTANVFG